MRIVSEELSARDQIIESFTFQINGTITAIDELRPNVPDEGIEYTAGHSELTPETSFKIANYHLLRVNHIYTVPMVQISYSDYDSRSTEYYYLGRYHSVSPKIGDQLELDLNPIRPKPKLPPIDTNTYISIRVEGWMWYEIQTGSLDYSVIDEDADKDTWLNHPVYLT